MLNRKWYFKKETVILISHNDKIPIKFLDWHYCFNLPAQTFSELALSKKPAESQAFQHLFFHVPKEFFLPENRPYNNQGDLINNKNKENSDRPKQQRRHGF